MLFGMADKTKKSAGYESMTFWERLQIAAQQANMPANPAYIAKLLGLNPSAVTKYKHGSFPHRRNLNKLARHYGANSEWLGSGIGAMSAEEIGEPVITEQEREVLRLWQLLPENAHARILANLQYEVRAAQVETTGQRRALTDEFAEKLAELLQLAEKSRQ